MVAKCSRCVLLIMLMLLAGSAELAWGQLQLANKAIPDARLVDLNDKGWVVETATNNRLQVAEVVRWGSWPGLTRQQAVWLSDGSWLAGELRVAPGPQVMVESDWFDIPPVDMSLVRGLVINPPASLHEWLKLQQQMQAVEGRQDVLWLLNKQRVSGIVRWETADANVLDDQELVLEGNNNQSVTIPWDTIQAIVLSPTLLGPVPPQPANSLGLSDGSLLHYERIELQQRSPVLVLPSGVRLSAVASLPEWLGAIRYVAGRPAGVRFLSEFEPASYRQASDNLLTWELGEDVDCYGQPLVSRPGSVVPAGEDTSRRSNKENERKVAVPSGPAGVVAKGLALHGPAQVAYRLPPGSKRFLAQAVLAEPHPQTTIPFGHAVCSVLLARNGKLEKVLEFELSRDESGSSQRLVDIDLTGAQLLVLLVENGKFASLGDQALWLDARLGE